MADKCTTSQASQQLRAMVSTVAIGPALDLAVWNGHAEITALMLDFTLEQWGGTNELVLAFCVRACACACARACACACVHITPT
jgi:hypothetical protein